MAKILEYRNMVLVEVIDGRLQTFGSVIDKALFRKQHREGTYDMHDNYAIEHLYMVVDPEGTGFNLTKRSAIPYNEAVDLINHYL